MNEAVVFLLVAYLAGVASGVLWLHLLLRKSVRLVASISTLEEGRDRTAGVATFWKEDYERGPITYGPYKFELDKELKEAFPDEEREP